MISGTDTEEVGAEKPIAVNAPGGWIDRSWLAMAAFIGAGVLWSVEAARGTPGIRPLLTAIGISLLASAAILVIAVLTRKASAGMSHRVSALAFSSSALLLPAFFLPEYALGGHVWPTRSMLLIALTAALFAALYWRKRQPIGIEAATRNQALSVGQRICFFTFVAAYFAVSVFASVRKFHTLGYAGQDLAYFSQIFYTTLHGRLFNSNFYQDLLYSGTVQSDFAGHNSPIQFLFVFFYRLVPSPATLLVVRDAMIALCAWPAYRLARNRFPAGVSAILAAMFLLVPAIAFQNIFEFYPFSLAAFFLLFTFDFYQRKQFALFGLGLFLTLLVREDLVFAVFALGMLALWQRRGWRWTLLPTVLAIAWAVLSWGIVLPHFLHGAPFRSNVCFCHLGATPAAMLTNIVHHPTQYILTRDSIVYLKQLTGPFGFVLPWLSPITLGALPYLAINLLGGAGECPTTSIFSQHSVVPTTFLFAGFLWSLDMIQQKAQRRGIFPSRIRFIIIAFAVALTVADLGFVFYPEQVQELQHKPYEQEARSVAALIPPEAAVAAPRYVCPLLPNRMSLYMTDDLFDYHHPAPEYIIVDRDFARMRRTPKWRVMYDRVTSTLEHDRNAEVIYSSSNYIVYRQTSANRLLNP